ncbi:bifunctional endoribonuclease/protein kinase ire1 [Vanrija albida]|uniref:Bifunctional endoribonuclease/protein kinase ire1 n=1 Tax=Vanrija albida TaxID=181172 RepID=A0ABR3Q9G5_9TREE
MHITFLTTLIFASVLLLLACATFADPSPGPDPQPFALGFPSLSGRSVRSSGSGKPAAAATDLPLLAQAEEHFEVEVLPFVLVSSIDGALHAVARDSGTVLWTLRDGVEPLVGGGTYGDRKGAEEYIVEPLSGNLYAFDDEATPKQGQAPKLRKLPITVEQILQNTPYFVPSSTTRTTITGSKHTSLLTLDLRTGQQLECFSSEKALDSLSGTAICENDLLDDLEGNGRRSRDTLFVGRTDYRLTIRTHPTQTEDGEAVSVPPPAKSVGVQDLKYSTYTPNSFDRTLADYWARTGGANLTRVELGYDGMIMGLEKSKGSKWNRYLDAVGVAVYDIVFPITPGGANPIILPQPPVDLATLVPAGSQPGANSGELNKPPSAYIASIPMRKALPAPESSESDKSDPNVSKPEDSPARSLLFAQSSSAYPIIALIHVPPRPERSPVNASFLLSEDDPERRSQRQLPPLLDPPPKEDNSVTTAPDEYDDESPVHVKKGWLWFFCTVVGALAVFGVAIFRLSKPKLQPVVDLTEKTERMPLLVKDASAVTDEKTSTPVVRFETPPGEDGEPGTPPKKKNTRRRVRGRKKGGRRGSVGPQDEPNGDNDDDDREDSGSPSEEKRLDDKPLPELPRSASSTQLPDDQERLAVSDTVIGFGSHGTVVLKGTWGGRPVAVKRLLSDFVRLASQEVKLLQASDDHPNVIRYYCQERRDNFLYIALDLCQASLADLIETPDRHLELASALDRKQALHQITGGLKHLHAMKIIHRDIKPQNVLVSKANNGQLKMLVSDFGLARRLEQGQSSFAPTANNLAGSLGWRAPECIRGQVKLNEGFDPVLSCSSSGSAASSSGSFADLTALVEEDGEKRGPSRRLTKAVDLFALGCLYFWVLMGGEHPFGETYNRESNIVKGDAVNMDHLSVLGEEGVEAQALIGELLSMEPDERPGTADCLIHPFFWTPAKRLSFLCDASDRFEIMETDPPEKTLEMLEEDAQSVVGKDWYSRMDKVFTSSLGKYRKYKGNTVRDLLRAMRNKKHHYQDLEPSAQRHFGTLPAGFLHYFTFKFPRLFLHVYGVVRNSRLRHESMFVDYFKE